jgi:hypothetical protein
MPNPPNADACRCGGIHEAVEKGSRRGDGGGSAHLHADGGREVGRQQERFFADLRRLAAVEGDVGPVDGEQELLVDVVRDLLDRLESHDDGGEVVSVQRHAGASRQDGLVLQALAVRFRVGVAHDHAVPEQEVGVGVQGEAAPGGHLEVRDDGVVEPDVHDLWIDDAGR